MAKAKKTNGEKAMDAAACEARTVARMTRRKRRAELVRLADALLGHFPTMAVVKSDPMKALLLIGAEFVARYFPDATHASLHVTKYPADGPGAPLYSVLIPLAVPAAEATKGGA